MSAQRRRLTLSSRNNLPIIGCFLFLFLATTFAGSALDSANTVYTKGDLKESIRLYKKALTVGENPVLCYFNCGNAYFQLDSLSRALAYYRQCIKLAPDFPKARLNLAKNPGPFPRLSLNMSIF
jgi:tetratricopeptide (TPR) repeat protein